MVPFWFQMSKPEMHYISGKHVLTHYRNIGDRDAYEEFILQENNGLINKERISQVKTAADGGPGIIPLGNSQHYIKREEYPSENRTWNGYEYCIPEYQRSYVWEEKQFRAFEESLKKNRNLGTIILYKRDEKTYEIVDGQQRLTTLGSMYKAIGASAPFPGVSNDRAKQYDSRQQCVKRGDKEW